MKTPHEHTKEGIIYLSGVMDEETRPILTASLDDLEEGEGMLVIFRLNEGESSDTLLESHVSDFSPNGWDCVSDKPSDKPLQSTISELSLLVNQKRLPNIVFVQADDKVKATDKHSACFGVIGGPRSKEITKIRKIVHQTLNMGLNGDLLLHENNLIMGALYKTGIIDKDQPLSFRSYGAGGSASHTVHPGDILTSNAVLDIRTHVNPIFIIEYLNRYLEAKSHPLGKQYEFLNDIKDLSVQIRQRFYNDPSYSSISIISDIESLIHLVSRATENSPEVIMANMKPQEKMYYGEISLSNSSQGARIIKRIIDPSFLGDDGQRSAKNHIVEFMNKMGEYERVQSRITELTKKRKAVHATHARALFKHAAFIEIEKRKAAQNQDDHPVVNLSEFSRVLKIRKLEAHKKALNQELEHLLYERDQLLEHGPELETECRHLRTEISKLRAIHGQLNPHQPFVITASGNIFFNHAEKEAVHQFGVQLVEMENHLFKQAIHKAIIDGCYVESELVTKIAADPVCIPDDATLRLNTWANQCTMTLDDYVSAYFWATSGEKKQDMKSIPPCGIWEPAIQIANLGYPCGILRIDTNPLEMSHHTLRKLLKNTPSYIIYNDKFYYANELMDIEIFITDSAHTSFVINELAIPYEDGHGSDAHHSEFRLLRDEELDWISELTQHRHQATYERLFYTLAPKGTFISDNTDSEEALSSTDEQDTSAFLGKEERIDILSSIGNGRAFAAPMYKNVPQEEHTLQIDLQTRARNISSSDEVNHHEIKTLINDYLNYTESKLEEGEIAEHPLSSNTESLSSLPDDHKILNPFWKEIGVDLLSEIGNGKAFSGSIYKEATAEEKERQQALQVRAKAIIRSSQEVSREVIRALFHDYLTYMVSKIPSEALAKRGIRPENGKYPVYARNAIYRTGYVSHEIDDWDAAIYKSNNSAVLVGLVDSFLEDKPVTSVGSEALVVYKKSEKAKSAEKKLSDNMIDFVDDEETKDEPDIICPLSMQSLLSAINLLSDLQHNTTLEEHHREALEKLTQTILASWDTTLNQTPRNKDYKEHFSDFCVKTKLAVHQTAQAFERNGALFCLVRPVLNLIFQFFNFIQRLFFKAPEVISMYKKGPKDIDFKQWQNIQNTMEKLWQCLENPQSIELEMRRLPHREEERHRPPSM